MAYSDLLLWQYRHKPKAKETIQLLEKEIGKGFSDLFQLQNVLNIEEAMGVNLDLVGKHIGQSRIINGYQLRKFFGFRGSIHSLSFSLTRNGGGQWYRKRDPLSDSVQLSDEDYRFLIKCRILKNYQLGTLPNILEACQFIFGEGCNVIDNYNMTVNIALPRTNLTNFKQFAINHLDILPRQAGVQFIYTIN